MFDALAKVWANPYARLVLIALGLALAVLFVRFTRRVWVIVLVAYLLAYLAHPLLSRLAQWRVPRSLGVLLVTAGLFLFFGAASVVSEEVVRHLARLAADLPGLLAPLGERLSRALPAASRLPLPAPLLEALSRAADAPQTFLSDLAGTLAAELRLVFGERTLLRGLALFVGGLTDLLAVVVLSLYLMWDFERINRSLILAWPGRYRPLALDLADKLERAVGGYVRGQVLVALSVALLYGVGLALIGVPLAAGLAFITGLFYPVPVVGILAALTPTLLLALSQGVPHFIGALLLFIVVNRAAEIVVSPLIMGRTTDLHPATMFIAIVAGAVFFGLAGALVAIPVAAFLKLLYTDYYLKSRWYLS